MKYRTVDGKIRHAHAPVGAPAIEDSNSSAGIEGMCRCGYHVCSQTGPCAPKEVAAETERQFPPGWLWRSLMCYEPEPVNEKEEPSPFEGSVDLNTQLEWVVLGPRASYTDSRGVLHTNASSEHSMKVRK